MRNQVIDKTVRKHYRMLMLEGQQITLLREALGLSRKDFAERMGVSEACLCRWEKGQRFPRREHMRVLNGLAKEAEKKGGVVLSV